MNYFNQWKYKVYLSLWIPSNFNECLYFELEIISIIRITFIIKAVLKGISRSRFLNNDDTMPLNHKYLNMYYIVTFT